MALLPLNSRLALALVLALACTACIDDAPANPTWTEDVRQILEAQCIKCHTSPPLDGAPDLFRLDVFDDTFVDGQAIRGAASMAQFIAARTSAGEMPPRLPLTDRQRDVLSNWWETAVAESRPPLRGDALSGNQTPTFSLTESLDRSRTSDGRLNIQYQIDDPDFDTVLGTLTAVPAVGSPIPIPGQLHGGRGIIVWDAAQATEGSYDLLAELNDGNELVFLTVAQYDVVHLDGNTAPIVTIDSPDRETGVFTDGTPAGISITITDPDPFDLANSPYRVDVDAVRGDVVFSIASNEPVTPGPIVFPWPEAGDSTMVAESANWRIRATVSDGSTSRTATSARFVVGHGPPTRVWADVEPIFMSFCAIRCHIGAGEVMLPTVNDNFNLFQSVFDKRALIYRRVVEQRLMPPTSAELIFGDWQDLSQQQRDDIADWILTGAEL